MIVFFVLGAALIAFGAFLIVKASSQDSKIEGFGVSFNVPSSVLILMVGVAVFVFPFTPWWPQETEDTTTVEPDGAITSPSAPTVSELPGTSAEAVTMEAEQGRFFEPMVVSSDVGASNGAYLSSPNPEDGAVVLGPFRLEGGDYIIEACALPLGTDPRGSDSAYLVVDNGPIRYLWDFFEDAPRLPSDWECETVSARCDGTFAAHGCNPLTLRLEAGMHTITLEVREPDFGVDVMTIRKQAD